MYEGPAVVFKPQGPEGLSESPALSFPSDTLHAAQGTELLIFWNNWRRRHNGQKNTVDSSVCCCVRTVLRMVTRSLQLSWDISRNETIGCGTCCHRSTAPVTPPLCFYGISAAQLGLSST